MKYEILFKLTKRSRRVIRWERFSDNFRDLVIGVYEAIQRDYGKDNPCLLSVKEIFNDKRGVA